jgi:hypothetical protein
MTKSTTEPRYLGTLQVYQCEVALRISHTKVPVFSFGTDMTNAPAGGFQGAAETAYEARTTPAPRLTNARASSAFRRTATFV